MLSFPLGLFSSADGDFISRSRFRDLLRLELFHLGRTLLRSGEFQQAGPRLQKGAESDQFQAHTLFGNGTVALRN